MEKGYHAVSTEQVASAAGVSKGLVHYHFTSKEQLLVCILKDILDELFTSLDNIAKGNDPAQEKIRSAIKSYLNLANSRLGLARITLFEDALTEKAKNYIIERAEENVLKLTGLVEDGIDKGEFRTVDSRLVANLITGAILEIMRGAVLQRRELITGELADEITDILCGGISR